MSNVELRLNSVELTQESILERQMRQELKIDKLEKMLRFKLVEKTPRERVAEKRELLIKMIYKFMNDEADEEDELKDYANFADSIIKELETRE